MLEQSVVGEVRRIVAERTGEDFSVSHTESIGGGCISRSYRISGARRAYFVKVNSAEWVANFQAEYIGLMQLAASGSVRVPVPLAATTVAGQALLVMEYLPLTHSPSRQEATPLWAQLGGELARLHSTPIADINRTLRGDHAASQTAAFASLLLPENEFGGTIANSTLGNQDGFLGTAPDWADFFVTHRLRFQLEQTRRIHGVHFRNEAQALQVCHALLSPPYQPAPSLTHGDLWSGNVGVAADTHGRRRAVVFDPAPYVADGETDLAFSELFGGFPPAFYDGYHAHRPLPAGYRQRKTIYNLYHVLNHYNLFGGGYGAQSQQMLNRICTYEC